MKLFKKVILCLGCIFFVCAGLAGSYAYHVSHHRWTVLEHPVRLEQGFLLSQPFTVELPTEYEVEIQCRRTLPFEALDATLVRELGATCSVMSKQAPITHGDSRVDIGIDSSQDFLSRRIGRFEAVPGQDYQLNLHLTHSLPQLASTRPEVKIIVEPYIQGRAFVASILYSYVAIACAGLGILFAFPVLLTMLPRQHVNPSPPI